MNELSDYFEREKSVATRAKHEFLSNYQKIWLGIILNYLKKRQGSLIYLDPCAGKGLFPSRSNSFLDQAGSPLIGLKNLLNGSSDERFEIDNKEFFAILFEVEKSLYGELIKNLRKYNIPENLYHAENASYLDRLDFILNRIRNSFVLSFFDPFSIAPIPYHAISQILTTGRTDALIYFPSSQIRRYQGHTHGEQFPGKESLISQMNDFFGTSDWQEIALNSHDGNEAVENLAHFYMDKLRGLDKYCLYADFLYEDQYNTLFKIILATASIDASLQAKYEFSKIEAFQASLRAKKLNQVLLFDENTQVWHKDPSEIAEDLIRFFRGRKVTGEDILSWAVFDGGVGVFKGNLRRSVTLLSRQERIDNPEKSKWNIRSKITFYK